MPMSTHEWILLFWSVLTFLALYAFGLWYYHRKVEGLPDSYQFWDDYKLACILGLCNVDRWETEIEHHPMSMRLMEFLKQHDLNDYDDYFCWKSGGDGDNGETLMFEMDAFFEMLDRRN